MIKKLTRQGNSSALIIDRPLMDLLDIDSDAIVKVTVEGRRMIIEPLSEQERTERFQRVHKRGMKRNETLYRKLAK